MQGNNLLIQALECGILDLSDIQEQMNMKKKEKILKAHAFNVWKGSNDYWYTYLPDGKGGRKQKRKKTKEALEDCIIEYYKNQDSEEVLVQKEIDQISKRNITIKELYERWIEYKFNHTNSSGYIKRITCSWKKYYLNDDYILNTPVIAFTKFDLDQWAHKLIKENNMTKKEYYNVTLILRQCIDLAVELKYIEYNYFSDVKIKPKIFVRTKKAPAETQVYHSTEYFKLKTALHNKFEKYPNNTTYFAILFAFETGVRIGELAALKFSDIEKNDPDNIHIQRQEIKNFKFNDDKTMTFSGFSILDHPKSDDGERKIPLTATAKEIIKNQEKMQKERGIDIDGYIFFKDGKRVNQDQLQKSIENCCKDAGLDVKRIHKIRKTYISTLIQSQLSIEEVRRIAGHADERVTYSNYCYNLLNRKETFDLVNKALERKEELMTNKVF